MKHPVLRCACNYVTWVAGLNIYNLFFLLEIIHKEFLHTNTVHVWQQSVVVLGTLLLALSEVISGHTDGTWS